MDCRLDVVWRTMRRGMRMMGLKRMRRRMKMKTTAVVSCRRTIVVAVARDRSRRCSSVWQHDRTVSASCSEPVGKAVLRDSGCL